MEREPCPVCGGDGRIETAHQSTTCPACHGTGKRGDDIGFRDVTKTKPEHHHPGGAKKAEKKTWPSSFEGAKLADEVKATNLAENAKAVLIQSIIDYEDRKGQVTKTFARLIRKKLRPA
jgi:DnaJ-class molecular chaperone